MTLLLVSVRSVREADIALAHGADIVDVKEPQRGSLGRADDRVLLAVQRQAAGRAVVSAAFGELQESPEPPPRQFVGLIKVGLSATDSQQIKDWFRKCPFRQRVVPVAYADWQRAGGPPPQAVLELACSIKVPGVLLDTWHKDGSRLLDWLTMSCLKKLRRDADQMGLFLAFAGSLRLSDVPRLLELKPDILGFRGAACQGADRTQTLNPLAVARLAEAVHASGHSTEMLRKLTIRTLGRRRAAWGNQGSTIPAAAQ